MKKHPIAKLLALTLAIGFFLVACQEEGISLDSPPPLTLFTWGATQDAATEDMKKAGWVLSSDVGNTIEFTLPLDELEDFKESKAISDEIPMPYVINLYFDTGSLSLARVIRRDTEKAIDLFVQNLKQDYGLSAPAWESEPSKRKTPAGNTIKESVNIYETDDEFIKVFRVEVDLALEKMEAGMHDDVEIRIFSKKENPGISIEGLTAN